MTKHIKDQNWFAVGLDFVIVVAGILIAFQITNWSELRSEREQEREIIERLHGEFIEIRKELDEKITALEDTVPRSKQLAQRLKNSPEQSDTAEISRLIAIFSLPSPPGVADTYTEIVANGTISLIKNNRLRNMLIRYATDTRAYTVGQQASREFTRPYVTPLSRFVYLLDDMSVSDALENAGSKADMLVALKAHEFIFVNELASFIEIKENLNKVIKMLELEIDSKS